MPHFLIVDAYMLILLTEASTPVQNEKEAKKL